MSIRRVTQRHCTYTTPARRLLPIFFSGPLCTVDDLTFRKQHCRDCTSSPFRVELLVSGHMRNPRSSQSGQLAMVRGGDRGKKMKFCLINVPILSMYTQQMQDNVRQYYAF